MAESAKPNGGPSAWGYWRPVLSSAWAATWSFSRAQLVVAVAFAVLSFALARITDQDAPVMTSLLYPLAILGVIWLGGLVVSLIRGPVEAARISAQAHASEIREAQDKWAREEAALRGDLGRAQETLDESRPKRLLVEQLRKGDAIHPVLGFNMEAAEAEAHRENDSKAVLNWEWETRTVIRTVAPEHEGDFRANKVMLSTGLFPNAPPPQFHEITDYRNALLASLREIIKAL